MAKTEEGKRTFTCSNVSCRKTFDNPLKTLNLRDDPAEPYLACPFCLAKIEGFKIEVDKETKPEKRVTEEKPVVVRPGSCQYHLGYLSEREQKEQIPDDCIVCKDIVECMLKKMRT